MLQYDPNIGGGGLLLPDISGLQHMYTVGVATALRAFEATYKAACKRHDTLPQKPLLNALQQAQENSSKYEKVVCSIAQPTTPEQWSPRRTAK